MAARKALPSGKWTIYYIGRGLELAGLILVSWSMVLFFGSSEMRPMLAMTGAGGALFFVGWLLARKEPSARAQREPKASREARGRGGGAPRH